MRRSMLVVFLFTLLASATLSAHAQGTILAETPPMGWNSWDSYGLTINETQFNANVDWFNKNLKAFGWQYVVIDEGWYLNHPENQGKPAWEYTLDKDGRYIPSESRFPSAANGAGFKALADSVHALGLKFGIHIIRGIPKEAVEKNLPIAGSSFHAAEAAEKSDVCEWNPDNYGLKANAAGQAYYDSLAQLYAGWGIDFIKVDCISRPYKDDEIRMMSQALKKTGRPIVLSLSPGATPLDKQTELDKYAQMWRISDDVWDFWERPKGQQWSPQSLKEQFKFAASWAGRAKPGHWPDADMLPFGHLGPVPGYGPVRDSKLSPDELQTFMTLWCIFRSPLFVGANLPESNASLLPLLTNREVLAVDQQSSENHPVVSTEKTVIWLAKAEAGTGPYDDIKIRPSTTATTSLDTVGQHYLAVFNISDEEQTVAYSWKDLKLTGSSYKVRDLWQGKNLGAAKSLSVTLKSHASVMYRLSQ
jgi:alpha-galactosidase